MFNNRFNSSKNDPLVEAVKQAQAEGDLRRQAVAAVNEQFGVFSRNAVVREDLAAYDAAIEEAYKCMKEGKPVLAKKDYDKDGKIESPKDEVWGSRFRAAKAAGKMEEGSAVSGEDPGMEVAKKAGAAQQSQTPSSTPAPTKSKDLSSTFSSARSATGMQEAKLDEISKELAGKYIKKADYKRSESSFRSGKVYGKELATKRRTKQDVEDSRKHNRDSFKREKGINMAVNKLTGRAKVQANEEVMKESIKAKLLAKHMKEDQSFKSAQVAESNKLSLGKSVDEAAMSNLPSVKGNSGFTYSRGASTPGVNPPHPSEKIGGFGNFKPAAGVGAGLRAGAGTLARSVGGVGGMAAMAAAPYAAAAMKKSYQQGHSATPGVSAHQSTPGVKASDSFARMRQMKAPEAAKPAAAPKAAAPAPVKQSFSQAFRAARAAVKPGEDANKAQFKWTNAKGVEGTYQAAEKKSQFVAPSKQIKTSVGSTATATATPKPAAAPDVPKPPSRPADINAPSAASVKQQFGSMADLQRDTAKAATSRSEPPTVRAPATDTSKMSVSGDTTEFGGSQKYSMPKDMKGEYTGAPATSIPSSGTRFRMPNELKGVNEEVQIGSNKYRIV